MESEPELCSGEECSNIDTLLMRDPLAGYGTVNPQPQYYKLKEKVFAEPIEVSLQGIHDAGNDNIDNAQDVDEISFIGNVTVQKSVGKQKKYHIYVDPSEPVCPQPNCTKTFTTITLMKAHVRKVHCAVRQFQCEICSSTFAARYLLRRHMAVHEGRKRECPVCGKMLSERTNLALHLRSHAHIRPHACVVCQKRFTRASVLRRHAACCAGRELALACR